MHGRGLVTVDKKAYAETRDRTGDLQIFSLTLSQLSYRGVALCDFAESLREDAPNDQTRSHHWGLNSGPSAYKADALPLSYSGAAARRPTNRPKRKFVEQDVAAEA